MADLHPTINAFLKVVQSGKKEDLIPLLAEDVLFKPPTYWKEWPGKEITARILSHVALIFKEFKYHRTIGDGQCFFLEFHCKVNGLDAVGVDSVDLIGNSFGGALALAFAIYIFCFQQLSIYQLSPIAIYY